MPGFANIHTHFTLIIAKGIYEDLSPPQQAAVHQRARAAAGAGALARRDDRDGAAGRAGGDPQRHDGGLGRQHLENYAQAIADTGLRLLLCEKAWDKAKGSIGDPGPFEVDAALGDDASPGPRRCTRNGMARATAASRSASRPGRRTCARRSCLRKLRALQDKLDTIATIHLNQIWGEVSAVEKLAQPQADRISRRRRLPERSADLRALPLHGARGGAAARRARARTSPSTPASRRAAA